MNEQSLGGMKPDWLRERRSHRSVRNRTLNERTRCSGMRSEWTGAHQMTPISLKPACCMNGLTTAVRNHTGQERLHRIGQSQNVLRKGTRLERNEIYQPGRECIDRTGPSEACIMNRLSQGEMKSDWTEMHGLHWSALSLHERTELQWNGLRPDRIA